MIAGSLNGAPWLTTDRKGGVSQGAFFSNNLAVHVGDDPVAVQANRAAVAERMSVTEVVFAQAAHSDGVHYVRAANGDVAGVDALITDQPGLALAALGADCAMVGLASADGWIAAVHCGWKGLVAQVLARTLQALAREGCDVTTLTGHVGPCICAHCYPVVADRAQAVSDVVPQAVVRTDHGFAVDLCAGVRAQLAAGGVPTTWDARCTAEDPDLYSYRRDGVTGRQALVITGAAA